MIDQRNHPGLQWIINMGFSIVMGGTPHLWMVDFRETTIKIRMI